MAFRPRLKEGLHAFVATPAYDGKVESEFAMSLANAAFTAPLFAIGMTMMVTGNGAFIDLARNVFCKTFLEKEDFKACTHLFFIDADINFQPNAFIGLIQSGLPICAGVYPRRQDPPSFPYVAWENPDGGGLWFVDDWLQCRRVPTGFLCIDRQVIEEMAPEAPQIHVHGQEGPVPWLFGTKFMKSKPEDPYESFIGEDYSFCDRYVEKYGKPVPVWSNFDFTHGRRWKGNLWEHLQNERSIEVDNVSPDNAA